MNKAIARLLHEYSLRRKIADETFIKRLTNILTHYLKVKDILNEVIIINKTNENDPRYKRYTEGFGSLFACALYDTVDKNMIVYERMINYCSYMTCDQYKLEGYDYYALYNLMIVQTIMHEFVHMLQRKNINNNDPENRLLSVLENLNDAEDTNTYRYSLSERLAEIKSLNVILEICGMLNIESPLILEYFSQKLDSTYKNGYEFEDEEGHVVEKETSIFTSPTEKYVKARNVDYDGYKKIESTIEGEDRLLYGLPIPLEEYKKLISKNNGPKL